MTPHVHDFDRDRFDRDRIDVTEHGSEGPEFVEVERRTRYGPEYLELLRQVQTIELEEAVKRLGEELTEATLLRIRLEHERELADAAHVGIIPAHGARPTSEIEEAIEELERQRVARIEARLSESLTETIARPFWWLSRLFLAPQEHDTRPPGTRARDETRDAGGGP